MTLKMVLDNSLLNTQQYKIRIKGKVEQSRERSSRYWKGSFLVALDYSCQLYISRKLTLCHSKLKNTQKKLFMDQKSFQGLPPVFGSHHIPFKAPAVISEKVYIPSALVVLFHNVNALVKMLFTQISTVLWKIVQLWLTVWLTFMHWVSGKCSVALQFSFSYSALRWFPRKFVTTKWLPGGLFSLAQCIIKNWNIHEFSYLRTIKYTRFEFFHAYLWELLEESKPVAFPVHCLHKVLYYF